MIRQLMRAALALALLAAPVAARAADVTPVIAPTGADAGHPRPAHTGETVGVPHGGTGAATLPAHGVVVGADAAPVAVTTPGTAGDPLVSGGASADPAFGTLGVHGGGTGDTSLSAHGVLVGQGASPVAATATGAAGQPLVSGGAAADPAYATLGVFGGGTGCSTGAGLCLDNITAWTSLGFISRAGGGTYHFFSENHGIPFSALELVGGSSYCGNQSTTTGTLTCYAWPTCADGQFVAYNPLDVPPVFCATPATVPSGANPFSIGTISLWAHVGAPSASPLGTASLYFRTDFPSLHVLLVSSAAVPAVVQSAAAAATSVAMTSTPAPGDMMVGYCSDYPGTPTAASGWLAFSSEGPGANIPSQVLVRKLATAGESTTQTPCSGSTGTVVDELSGVTDWAAQYQGHQSANTNSGGGSLNLSFTTTSPNTLVLGAWHDRDGHTGTVTGLTQAITPAVAGTAAAADQFPVNASGVSATGNFTGACCVAGTLIKIIPGISSWAPLSFLSDLQVAGISISKVGGSTLGFKALNLGAGLTGSCSTAADGLDVCTASATGPTGSGTTGALAKWTGTSALGAGDLTGDVTTSGTTATTIAAGAVTESKIGLSNVTTNNCSVTKHGFAPIAPNDATKYLDGTCNWSIPAGGGGGGGTTNNYYGALVQYTKVQLHANTSVANNSFASFSWSASDILQDDVSSWSSGNPTRFTVPSGYGKIRVTLNASWASNSTGTRWAYLVKNGTVAGIVEDVRAAVNEGASGPISTWVPVSAGDYFEIVFAQSSGGALNLSGAATTPAQATAVSIEWLPNTNVVSPQPTPGLPVICEIVTSGSAASVTIGGGTGSCPTLPSTYRDLKVVVTGRTTAAAANADINLRLNGDSAADYDYQLDLVNNGTLAAGAQVAQTSADIGWLPGSTGNALERGGSDITIQDYTNASFWKHYSGASQYVRQGTTAASTFGGSFVGDWRSTSAVTSLTLTPTSGSFVDGTVITVYGIGGSPTATLPVVPPQGRLSLTSGQAIPTTDVAGATTIYWVPLPGAMLPVGNVIYRPGQMSFALNATAHVAGSLYDIGAFNNGGSLALCTAPAWTSSTARSAAISQDATNGVWENTASLTCTLSGSTSTTTIAAGNWTYLGTFHASANGQVTWTCHPAAAAGGSNNELGLFNAYNQKPMKCLNRDSTASWTYASATWRAMNAGGAGSGLNNRVSWVDGLQQSSVQAQRSITVNVAANVTTDILIGLDLDSTSAQPDLTPQTTFNSTSGLVASPSVTETFQPQLGFHFVQAVEAVATANTANFFGAVTTPTRQLNGMTFDIEMGLWIEPANDNRLPWPAPLVLLPAIRRRRPHASAARAA